MYDVAIVGGGFRGLITAYLALKKGLTVALIDSSPDLGGFLNSFDWNGYVVDRGVQLFDSVPRELENIVTNDLGINVDQIDFTYGSVFDGITTPGFALPDFSNISRKDKSKILLELIETLEQPDADINNLDNFLCHRYGPTAASYYRASFKNIYRLPTQKADISALTQTAFHRIHFLNDKLSLELKKNPSLDMKLAARRVVIGKVDEFVSFYPSSGGMRSIVTAFENKISDLGGVLQPKYDIADITGDDDSGYVIESSSPGVRRFLSKKIVWCAPVSKLEEILLSRNIISKLEHGTPMVSCAFEVPSSAVNNFTYFHQFSANTLVYRSSAMGVYSNQIKADGKTFVTAECPTDKGTEFWNNPEKFMQDVWDELVSMELIKHGEILPNVRFFSCLPSTHRIPLVGHENALGNFEKHMALRHKNILIEGNKAFLRREIFLNAKSMVEKLAA